jgi:glycolate oxidase FAD binding subunit
MTADPVSGPAASLAALCGAGHVRPGTVADAVRGVAPGLVVTPADDGEVAAVLRTAASQRLAVLAGGAGTKRDWGGVPGQVDLLVDVRRLCGVREHAAGDLVARVGAGTPLAAVQDAVRPAGQRLALDDVVPGATVGGVVATGCAGPSRLLFGGPRDLVIGITVARPDGRLTRSGGKVVKNVAGYDLGKLYTGSFGTLGVITEVIFRLHPVPTSVRYVLATLPPGPAGDGLLAEVVGGQEAATAIEVHQAHGSGPVVVGVALEGTGAGAQARAAALAARLGGDAEVGAQPPSWWGMPAGEVVLRLAVEISAVPLVLRELWRAVDTAGLDARVTGSAGVGVLYAGLAGAVEPEEVARVLQAVRRAVTAAGGSAVVVRCPDALAATLDVWGPVPALDLMRRLRREFDPDGRMVAGRFVGGL